MSNAVYPALPGLQFPIAKTPIWKTKVDTTPSGREYRSTPRTRARYRIGLQYEFLREDASLREYQALADFFDARRGAYDSFLFSDPTDNRVTLQRIVTGDGVTSAWQLGRSLNTNRNLLAYSSRYNAGGWTASQIESISAPIYPAPVVGEYAQAVMPSRVASSHTLAAVTGGVLVGETVTASIYLKSAGAPFAVLQFGSAGAFAGTPSDVRVDLSTGAFVAGQAGSPLTRQCVDVGGGWYRVSITDVASASGSVQCILYLSISSTLSAAGNGVAATLVFGAQFERGSSPSPLVETHGVAAVEDLQPVFNFDGAPEVYINDWSGVNLLQKTARTNLLLQSQTLDSATWTKTASTVTANAVTAPDGTLTADKIAEDATTASHGIAQTVAVTSGSVYTISLYLKAAERSWALVTTAGNGLFVDLSTGALGAVNAAYSTVTVQSVGSGWWLVKATRLAPSASMAISVIVATADGTSSYAGTAGSGVYAWGLQLEASAARGRYIPTTTATVTITDYTLSSTGLVTLAAPLPLNSQLLWSGSYFWRCRFDADEMDLQQFMARFWRTGQVKLLTVNE